MDLEKGDSHNEALYIAEMDFTETQHSGGNFYRFIAVTLVSIILITVIVYMSMRETITQNAIKPLYHVYGPFGMNRDTPPEDRYNAMASYP